MHGRDCKILSRFLQGAFQELSCKLRKKEIETAKLGEKKYIHFKEEEAIYE